MNEVIPVLLFARSNEKGKWGFRAAQLEEEKQPHILIEIAEIINETPVGIDSAPERGESVLGLAFFTEKSIDVVINVLEKAKEILREEIATKEDTSDET